MSSPAPFSSSGPSHRRLRGSWGRAALVLVAVLGSGAGCGPKRDIEAVLERDAARGFHVVLVTLDTTRADHLGAYGYELAETPVLDRLAAGGILFRDAVSPAPLTLPAHASILTGLDPQHHGVRNNGQYRLEDDHRTLAEILAERGYATAAFVSAFVLDRRYGLAQGFQVYDDRVEPAPGQAFGGLDSQRSAEAVTDAVLQWLDGRSGNEPFFLWTHYYDPHAEYAPPEDYARRFEDRLYDGEIAYMDASLGRLIEALRKYEENVLVVVLGDHGESLGEHGERLHSHFLYEATQHVPLILWSPALFDGPFVVDDAVVGLVDVVPTILALLGIDDDVSRDGIHLGESRKQPERAVYMETMAPFLDNGWAPLHGLRRHRDKYILAPKPEYYDLSSDPRELDNLFGAGLPEVEATISRLAEALAGELEGTPAREAVAAAAVEPDADSLERLRALGYLSGPGLASAAASSQGLPDPKDMMPVRALLTEARGLRQTQRYAEALEMAQEALSRAPKDLEALQELGLIYIEMDRLEEAEDVLRRYRELKPNPNINILLAQILWKSERVNEARMLLDEARRLEPDHGGVLITYGDFLADQGKVEEALDLYERAKEVDPYRATETADRHIAQLRRRMSR